MPDLDLMLQYVSPTGAALFYSRRDSSRLYLMEGKERIPELFDGRKEKLWNHFPEGNQFLLRANDDKVFTDAEVAADYARALGTFNKYWTEVCFYVQEEDIEIKQSWANILERLRHEILLFRHLDTLSAIPGYKSAERHFFMSPENFYRELKPRLERLRGSLE